MDIRIKSLSISFFKGIEDLTLNLDGKSAVIKGRNGTGKTTVFDAFCWCLFGKDSAGSADFDVKPVHADGQRLRGTDTNVVCTLIVDGREVTYSRTLHEKWKTTPGEKAPTYMGDETICSIDGVPKKVGEYKAAVNLLIGDDEVFRLITIHGAFMAMHWETRRRYLMSMAGGNPEQELMSRPEFAGIEDVLKGSSIDDARKRLKSELKGYNDELNSIPIRIDESRKWLSSYGISKAEYEAVIAKRNELKAEYDRLNDQIAGGEESFKAVNDLVNEERAISNQQTAIVNRILSENMKARNEKSQKLSELSSMCELMNREINRLADTVVDLENEIESNKAEREDLLSQWHSVDEAEFNEPEGNGICPYCGQQLPDEKIQEMMVNAANEFIKNRDDQLSFISSCGKRVAEKIASLENEKKRVLESISRKRDAYNLRVAELQEITDTPVVAIDAMADPEYIALEERKKSIHERFSKMDDSKTGRELLQKRRDSVSDEIASYDEKVVAYSMAEKQQARIAEYEQRQAELGRIVAGMAGKIDLLRRFTMATCSAVEDSINSLFTNIRWKLFRELKGDGVEPCCDATVGGVTYGRGLNYAACVNAGIEIIEVLSKQYGIHAPCFVDNAESVNNMSYTGGQMIKLAVTEDTELVLVKED